ncbi:MAG: hypothetical protein ACPHZB_05115, partial [Flavobacteriales bacterium]
MFTWQALCVTFELQTLQPRVRIPERRPVDERSNLGGEMSNSNPQTMKHLFLAGAALFFSVASWAQC